MRDPWGGGEFIKSVGEEYKVVKRGMEYHGFEEEYNVEKGKVISSSLPFNIDAVGKKIKWGRGEGDGNFGEENKDHKKWGWGRKSSRELYTAPNLALSER